MSTDNQLRETWDIELDLLEKLKNICKKYELHYFACAGTLLGAVRHKGFIPWDDDIDVLLMWPDYKKLLEVAPQECSYPYFFQCPLTEKDVAPSACRLRRSDTTGFTRWELENQGPDYNKGIFIDVFPLFNVPDTEELRSRQKTEVVNIWYCIHAIDAIKQQKRGGFVNKKYESYIPILMDFCKQKGVSEIDDIDVTRLRLEYLEACASETHRTREVGATSSYCHRPNLMWNTEWYDQSIELPFENTTINCPAEYEKVLEKQYGDWRTPVKDGAVHEMVAVDTRTPWREFEMSSIQRILND